MRTFDFTTYSSQELAQVRAALQSLVDAPGWKVFIRFLQDREREIGIRALDDDTQPKDYWKGFRDGCRVGQSVDDILARATDEIESREVEVEDSMGILRGVHPVTEEDL